jgi:hypothetical protein
MARAANLEVKLPPHVKPTDEASEALIKKFLKECSKESLVQYLFDNSAWTRRFTKKSIKTRAKKLLRTRNSKKYNEEINGDKIQTPKKKKKYSNNGRQTAQKKE